MPNKDAFFDKNELNNEDILESFNFDELEENLQNQLEEELSELEFLSNEKEKIGNPDYLGNVIMDIIWDQFTQQISVIAGEDFIKENNGLKLDLRDEAHIQTTENFKDGKIATHNTKIDYKERYDNWQENFLKDEYGNIIYNKTKSGKEQPTLIKGARKEFDKDRPKGSIKNHTDMDHTVSAAEIIRNPAMNAHMTKKQQIDFANSKENLYEMDSSLNRSKGDASTTEWLDNKNSKGQKPKDIFNITDEDDKKLRQKNTEARNEQKKRIEEGEKESILSGKQSKKEESFRIGGKVLRAVIMQLLADLVKEIILKLVKWIKSIKKDINTLLLSLKEAINSFINKMNEHLINIGDTLFSTISTAIIGPIFMTIKKFFILLKISYKSIKDSINYLKSPNNKEKPIGSLIFEVGKIMVAGLTGSGALLLSEIIEKELLTVPIFAKEIPLMGSLANVLGIFFGAMVSGIIGAIIINFIDKKIEKKQKSDIICQQVDKNNQVLNIQNQVEILNEEKFEKTKENSVNNIIDNHTIAANIMNELIQNINENLDYDDSIQNTFDDIDNLFDKL